MSEEQAFLDQLIANPGDDVTRLVYADWLEERGDERGAYLRAELELAALDENDPRYADLNRQMSEWASRFPPEWIESAGRRWDVWLLGYSGEYKIAMIKVLRDLTGCGLAECKTIVESLPAPVAVRVSRVSGEAIRTNFRTVSFYSGHIETNAQVALRPWSAESESSVYQPPSYYRLLLSGPRPRRKTAAIQALSGAFSLPPSEAKHILEAAPFPMGEYPTEEDARRVAEHLEETIHVEIGRVDRPAIPRPQAVGTAPVFGTGPFTVRLVSYDLNKKINVIKAIRELLGLGLAEAKAYSERPFPIVLRENVGQSEGEAFARRFAELGPVDIISSSQ